MAKQPAPLRDSCPQCGSTALILGSPLGPDRDGFNAFRPKELKPFSLRLTETVDQLCPMQACTVCGMIFSYVDPAALRRLVVKHGKREIASLYGNEPTEAAP